MPGWLRDPTAGRPNTLDDFLGSYQFVWAPAMQWHLIKEGDRYFLMGYGLTSWDPAEAQQRVELTPLPDGEGFEWGGAKKSLRLVYNHARRRYEMVHEEEWDAPRAPPFRTPPVQIGLCPPAGFG